MPVNTAALKSFAPAMRRQLMEAVGRKLDLLLTSQTPDTLSTYASQIAELRERATENREQLLEQVAYSWFNRLAALRYLDAKGWHPFGCKVLMPAGEGETQPELLKLMRSGSLPLELKEHTNESRLNGLLDGQIPTAIAGADPQGEVYRELVLGVCRSYHQLLPNLFEGLDDATELLLPDDQLTDGSIAGAFRSQISDDDCEDVEILGWLYQFYIAEKKDEVMARKKAVPTEDIPAVTQLFTPHWIVRYLVENSLGRLWLLNRPESKLRDQMPYYIEGETETDFLRITKPEEIKLLDPACGSGHMLTYAFDLLSHIYTEEGYAAAEIPGLILQHNLYGLDICPRAAQLAGLALVLKAREQSRRFFQPGQLVQPQIIELQDVRFDAGELNDYIEALDLGELFDPNLFKLLHQFEEAKNFGSLIQPCLDERAIADIRRGIEAMDLGGQLFLRETHFKVLCVLVQAEALTQRYHVTAANPPYMGSVSFNPNLKAFVKNITDEGRTDLFALFITRLAQLTIPGGFESMITMQGWLFLSSYESLRRTLLTQWTISSLAHLGPRAFDSLGGEVVQVAAFVIKTLRCAIHRGAYFRLLEGRNEQEKQSALLASIGDHNSPVRFSPSSESLLQIPGCPIAYWLSDNMIRCFAQGKPLEQKLTFKQGAATSDNGRFLRFWHEIAQCKTNFDCTGPKDLAASASKWFPYNKGGTFRKWYGNNEYVVNWERDGEEMKAFTATLPQGTWVRLKSRDFYCLPCITYSSLSGGAFGGRVCDEGFLFDTKGSCIFGSPSLLLQYSGLLNSEPAKRFLDVLCPTLDYSMVGIKQVPTPTIEDVQNADVVVGCCKLARADWDNFENSWDFVDLPLLRPGLKGATLETSWRNWEAQSTAAIRRMQELETENNRLFIAAYGLKGELQPEVPEDQITLARADQRKDIAAFLSYATGCMMGRYSLDHPGLILANAGDTLEHFYEKVRKSSDAVAFQPDSDGIIPVLDGEWFEDDIVARSREFLRVCFPASSLNTDLAFIETALGKDLRKYFCSDFYKDHLQTYKKRPIYWLVQSPAGPAKGGFACLIYLHRYTKDTLNLVLNNYFRPYLQKLEARQAQLGLDQLNDALPTRDRTAARKEAEKITKVLKECQAWEQDSLLPLAQQRIELDLDDGVKVNYLKLQDVLAPIPGLAAKEE